jgi:uncharacterized protein with PQ loop repeat
VPRLTAPDAATMLGLASVVLASWFTVPQLLRLARTRSVAGISLEGLVCSAVSLTAWTAYGLAFGKPWVVASSVVGLPATLATLGFAARQGARPRPHLAVAWASVLSGTVVLDRVLGTRLIDLVLGCSIVWLVAPAALTAWRSTDVSGLAAQTWLVLAAEGLVFLLYGVLGDVGADRAYGTTALTGALVVLARIPLGGRVGANVGAPVGSTVGA